jgi:hypothetical protein
MNTPLILRTFTVETEEGTLQIQESALPEDVRIRIDLPGSGYAEARMNEAQFKAMCKLGRPDRDSYYTENEDQVRFQSGSPTNPCPNP